MSEFKKEKRYVVLKLSKLTDHQKTALGAVLAEIDIGAEAMPECVVVEHDWPNYADTWSAIQEITEGRYVSRDALAAQVEQLKGIKPQNPPRPPFGGGLPRYGINWNGPEQPLAVPMDDGYWTPYHLVEAHNAALAAQIEALRSAMTNAVNVTDLSATSEQTSAVYRMESALAATPATCLAQVRAEAVRDFFSAWQQQTKHKSLSSFAAYYAERIRQGGAV